MRLELDFWLQLAPVLPVLHHHLTKQPLLGIIPSSPDNLPQKVHLRLAIGHVFHPRLYIEQPLHLLVLLSVREILLLLAQLDFFPSLALLLARLAILPILFVLIVVSAAVPAAPAAAAAAAVFIVVASVSGTAVSAPAVFPAPAILFFGH